jgi:hypothetical protein
MDQDFDVISPQQHVQTEESRQIVLAVPNTSSGPLGRKQGEDGHTAAPASHLGPARIIQRIGALAYKLELPPHLTGVHNVFHAMEEMLETEENQKPDA